MPGSSVKTDRKDANGKRFYDRILTEMTALGGSEKVGAGSSGQGPSPRAGHGAKSPQRNDAASASTADASGNFPEGIGSIVRKHLGVN